MNIGDYIRAKRKNSGYTIKELSEKSGVSSGGIQQIETNRRPNPRTDTLIKLAKVLDFSDIRKETGLVWFGETERNYKEDLFRTIDEEIPPPLNYPEDSILSFMEGTPFDDFPEPIRDDEIYISPYSRTKMDAVPGELEEIINTLPQNLKEKATNYYISNRFTYLPLIDEKNIPDLTSGITKEMAKRWYPISKREKVEADFVIEAPDNSMEEKGIFKGTICFIKKDLKIASGNIVLIMGENKKTLIRKITAIKNIQIFQNGKGEIDYFDSNFKIIGKVVRTEFNLK